MKNNAGFSLMELLIAVSLASMVLMGVASIAAQMVRLQVDGIRTGTVIGWSLASYTAMAKEIEDANVLAFPIANLASANQVIVCRNWSRGIGAAGGPLDAAVASTVVQYCLDPTAATAPETGFRLRRYAYTGNCPNPGAPAVCTSGAPGGPWTQADVVGFRVDTLLEAGSPNVFTRDNSIGGVRLRYAVGRQVATTNEPIPKFTPYNITVSMAKAYGNALD